MKQILVIDDPVPPDTEIPATLCGCPVRFVNTRQAILPAIHEIQPELIILDLNYRESEINMAIYDILEEINTLRREKGLQCHILIVSAWLYGEFAFHAEEFGINGYLFKSDAAPEQICEAIAKMQNGEFAASWYIELMRMDLDDRKTIKSLELTDLETKVMAMEICELTPRQITRGLQITSDTLHQTRMSLQRKLGVNSMLEVLTEALKWQLLSWDKTVAIVEEALPL